MTEATRLRPLFRPFVVRPALWTALGALLLMPAYFAVWEPIARLAGNLAWAGIGALLLLPAWVLFARIVAHRKTEYLLYPERIVVRLGGVFSERTVELSLRNVTEVTWHSPFLLKSFYGVGHISVSEAGNAAQNVRMLCIEDPGAIYRQIAKNMRAQGFSMQRNARVAREKSGWLGASVDMGGFGLGLAILIASAVGEAAEFWRVFVELSSAGFRAAIAAHIDAATRSALAQDLVVWMRTVGLLAGLVGALGMLLFMLALFIQLARRTYTLYDDVVDYFEGFLGETRKFIPLENLTDTHLDRPFFKRILGLSDLRVSARGAGTDMLFSSMPNAPAFASALERQLDAVRPLQAPTEVDTAAIAPIPGLDFGSAPAPRISPHAGANTPPGTVQTAPAAPGSTSRSGGAATSGSTRPALDIPTFTFHPRPLRAAFTILLRLAALPALMLVGLGVQFLTMRVDVGPDPLIMALGLSTMMMIAGGILLLGVLLAGGRAFIVARATEYSFDGRRAQSVFDFFHRRETRFSIDQVTSMTVLENPIDRMLGTHTIQLRSVGSAQPLVFAHIDRDARRLRALQAALGLVDPTAAPHTPPGTVQNPTTAAPNTPPGTVQNPASAPPTATLRPNFSVPTSFRAQLAAYITSVLSMLVATGVLTLLDHTAIAVWLWVAFAGLVWPIGLLIEALATRRMRVEFGPHALSVRGGILVHYDHQAAYAHIKGVHSKRYPWGDAGKLSAVTGGGFTMHVPFLQDVGTRHDQLDARLGAPGATPAASGDAALFQPSVGAYLARHITAMAIPIVPLLFLPATIPWMIWRARNTSYRIEDTRIQVVTAFLYHTRVSVLHARIDHLETSRDMLNKLSKTTDLEVYTVGSPTVDLVLRDLAAPQPPLDLIRQRMLTNQPAPAPHARA